MDDIRKIIHIDMDAFYASVEQRDNPEYQGKPLVVGGKSKRGVISAASYEARKYGIRSAMSSVVAAKKCPHLIFVKPRFDIYKSVSKQINQIFKEYTDLVEPLSLDEAFLDVTKNKKGPPSATLIAKEIKERIKKETALTCSAGISYNKFLAKIASDYKKPDGLFVVTPQKALEFIEQLRIELFFGVGKVTAKKMHEYGIFTGKDLKAWPLNSLVRIFGKSGRFYFNIARGIDLREVQPFRLQKSIGAENTFEKDLYTFKSILPELNTIASRVYARLTKADKYGRTITLKVKFGNFELHTKSRTMQQPVYAREELNRVVYQLMNKFEIPDSGIRLLGISVSNIDYKGIHRYPVQLSLNL